MGATRVIAPDYCTLMHDLRFSTWRTYRYSTDLPVLPSFDISNFGYPLNAPRSLINARNTHFWTRPINCFIMMLRPLQGKLCFIRNLVLLSAVSLVPCYCSSASQSATLKSTWDFRSATSKATVLAQISSSPYASLFNPNASPLVNSANVSSIDRNYNNK